MTELELRSRVAGIMMGWVGGVRGGSEHLEALSIYNAYRPLARGYAVQRTDSYCATAQSAAWIKAGIAAYTGTECSCNNLIEIARAKGIWVERDDYVPQVGDSVLYDWDDNKKTFAATDCTGSAEHIGCVVVSGSGRFTVAEGNTSGGKFGTREMQVNGLYIRGFICPPYARIAAEMTAEEAPLPPEPWAKASAEKAVSNGIIQGDENGDCLWHEPITTERLALILDRLGLLG